MSDTIGYQQDGFINGWGSASLAEANRELASARNATPENIRDRFRSQIRTLVKDGGIAWCWVLK